MADRKRERDDMRKGRKRLRPKKRQIEIDREQAVVFKNEHNCHLAKLIIWQYFHPPFCQFNSI